MQRGKIGKASLLLGIIFLATLLFVPFMGLTARAEDSNAEITYAGKTGQGSDEYMGDPMDVYWIDASVQHSDDYTKIIGFSLNVTMTKHGNYGGGVEDDTFQCGMILTTRGKHDPNEYVFTYPNGQTPSFDLSTETIVGIGVGESGWLASMAFSPSVSLEDQMTDGSTATLTYRTKEALFEEGDPVMTLVSFIGEFTYNSIEWITGEPEEIEEQPWDKVEKEVYADVATVSDDKQNGSNYVDITLPKTGEDSYPVVFWIHGGGYITGDRKNCLLDTTKEYFLAQGYAFVSAEYTLTEATTTNGVTTYGKGGMPQMLYDLKAAVRFLRANAEQYKLDTRFIAAMGESAGAGLALLMATTNGKEGVNYEDLTMGNAEYSSEVQAAISVCGPTIFTGEDIGNMAAYLGEDMDFAKYTTDADYKAEIDELAIAWSPYEQVNVDTPPLYLAYSKGDTTVDFHHGEDFYDIASMFMDTDDIVTAFYSEGGHVDRNTFDSYSAYVSYVEFLNEKYAEVIETDTPVDPDPDPEPGTDPNEPEGPNVGLIVGLSVGGVVIVAAAIVAAVIIVKKKKGGNRDEESK